MKRVALILLAGMLLASSAEARGKRSKSGLNDKNPSEDFSSHFDQEVKYDREHPKADEASSSTTEAPAPKKKRSSSSHRRRSKPSTPAPSTTDSL
ncbi:MAG: hypothetical protein JST54_23205 [Deltaproteobacteria bacterium]|nr:hypothetical protein [Deltaproteobacteria bacterium]